MANFGCGKTFHAAWDNFDFQSKHPEVRTVNLLQPLALPDQSYEMVYSSHVLEHLPREMAAPILCEFKRILLPGGILRLVVPDLESIAREYLRQLEAAANEQVEARDRHAWMCLELLDQFVRRQSGGFMARWWQSIPMPAREYVLGRMGDEAKSWTGKVDRPGGSACTPDRIYEVPDSNRRRERRFRTSGELHQWAYDRVALKILLNSCGFAEVKTFTADESYRPDFKQYCLDTTPQGDIRKPNSLFMEAKRPS